MIFKKKIHLLHILFLQLVQGLSGLKKSKEVYFPFRTHSVLFALFYIYLIFRSLCVHLEFWAQLCGYQIKMEAVVVIVLLLNTQSVLKSFHAVDILAIFAATQASLKQQMTLLSARNSQHHALKPAVIIENGSLCKYQLDIEQGLYYLEQ